MVRLDVGDFREVMLVLEHLRPAAREVLFGKSLKHQLQLLDDPVDANPPAADLLHHEALAIRHPDHLPQVGDDERA